MRPLWLVPLVCSFGASLQATSLTGAVNFSATSNGDATGGQIWNTLGSPDFFFNLYLIDLSTSTFINSGNGAATSPNFPLTPGSYTFGLRGEPGLAFAFFGLNLFFNGSLTPQISVLVPQNTGAFTANSSSSTVALNGSAVAGSGSTSFLDGTILVTLTAYSWFTTADQGNLVGAYDNTPAGSNDFYGTVSLRVEDTNPIPEPAGLGLLGLGLLAMGALRRRCA